MDRGQPSERRKICVLHSPELNSMIIDREIFRAYDIRGVYPKQLNEEIAEKIGRALGTVFIKKGYKTVVVGRDDRKSSVSVSSSLVSGLLKTGCDVVFVGVTVEPAIHYFSFMESIDAAVNVTASHNPGEFGGIKVDYKNAVPLFGEELSRIVDIIEREDFTSGSGVYREEDLTQKYIEFIASKFRLTKPIKVVIYCGNGATSEIYPKILESIGARVVPLRCYLDDAFPKGIPDPETGNFYPELAAEVLQSRAKLGVGFDGDGDRVGDVDEKGKSYRADQMLVLYAKDLLLRFPKSTIAMDVKCSQVSQDYIKKLGGTPLMLRTGRAYFLEIMRDKKAMLAAELSGHIYFNEDFYGVDDGIYATCKLLKIMDESGQKLSKLMAEFPTAHSTPELKIDCDDSKKFEIVASVVRDIKKQGGYLDVNETDGARVSVSETGWFLVRASNTSPYISVRAEGKDSIEVANLIDKLAKLLAKYDAILKI